MDICKPYEHVQIIIGIPVFNEHRFIEKTLRSLAVQTEENFLVVISDNFSEDGTSEICKRFCEQDKRFEYFRHDDNIGAGKNFEFLYRNTISPYFMWLGGHDYLDPKYLSTQINILNAYEKVGLVYSKAVWVDQDDFFIKETDGGDFVRNSDDGLIRYLDTINCRWGECTAINGIFRRSVLNGIKFFQFPGPDHWVLTRVQYFGKCYRTEDPIYFRREIPHRKLNSMQRVVGENRQWKEPNKWLSRMWPLAIEQIKDYCQLPEPLSRKIYYFPKLLINLELGYGLIFKYYRKLAAGYIKNFWSKFIQKIK